MKWLRSLYVGEKIKEDKAAVIRLIEHPEWKSRVKMGVNLGKNFFGK